jgi:hypothetical protein
MRSQKGDSPGVVSIDWVCGRQIRFDLGDMRFDVRIIEIECRKRINYALPKKRDDHQPINTFRLRVFAQFAKSDRAMPAPIAN